MNGEQGEQEELPPFVLQQQRQQEELPPFVQQQQQQEELPPFVLQQREEPQPREPEAEGQLATFARRAINAAPATVAGLGAGAYAAPIFSAAGSTLGRVIGGAAGTFGGPAGTVAGWLAGGALGGYLGEKVYSAGKELLGIDDAKQMAVNAKTHPWTSAAGEVAPTILGLRPGANVVQGAAGFLSSPTGQRVTSGVVSGAVEGGMQAARGEFEPERLVANVAAGVALPGTRGWLTNIEQRGKDLVGRTVPHGTPGSKGAAGTAEEQPQPSTAPTGDPQNQPTPAGVHYGKTDWESGRYPARPEGEQTFGTPIREQHEDPAVAQAMRREPIQEPGVASEARAPGPTGDDVPTIEQRIQDAYAKSTGGKFNTRGLMRDIRAELPDVDRATLDAALKRMQQQGKLILMPMDNRRELTPADRLAALRIGQESREIVWMERPLEPAASPAPPPREALEQRAPAAEPVRYGVAKDPDAGTHVLFRNDEAVGEFKTRGEALKALNRAKISDAAAQRAQPAQQQQQQQQQQQPRRSIDERIAALDMDKMSGPELAAELRSIAAQARREHQVPRAERYERAAKAAEAEIQRAAGAPPGAPPVTPVGAAPPGAGGPASPPTRYRVGAGGAGRPPPPPPPPGAAAAAAGATGGGGAAQAQAHVLSRVAPTQSWLSKIPKSRDEAKALWGRFYQAAKAEFHPLKQLSDIDPNLSPEENFYILARNTKGLVGRVQSMFQDGTYNVLTKQKNGASLDQVLKPVADDPQGFTAYALAKRAIELDGRGIKVGINMPEAHTLAASGAARWEPVLRELVAYEHRSGVDNLVRAGMLSPEAGARIKAAGTSYIPLERLLSPKSELARQLGAGLKVHDPIHRIKGNEDLLIIDPIDTVVKNTFIHTDIAERNLVLQALKKFNDRLPASLQFMTRRRDVHPITVKSDELNRFNAQHGVPSSIADDLTIFRPDVFRPSENRIRIFKNGKPEVYEVPELLGKAINAMDAQSMDLLWRILGTPARTLRAGSVLAPEFIVKNPIRDQFSALIQSKFGYVPIYDAARALGHIFGDGGKGSQQYWNWMRDGGANANLVSMDRKLIGLDPKTFAGKLENVVTKPIQLLQMASETLENATRMGVYLRAIEKGASRTEAAFQGREGTSDFARVGGSPAVKAVNALIPFFNAQVEGIDRAARAFKNDKAGFLLKAGASITLPSIYLWFQNHNDPRYKELPRWEKDLFWHVITDKWVDVTKKEQLDRLREVDSFYKRQLPNGQWQYNQGRVWRIPKPFEIGVLFGSVPERVLDAYYAHDPNAFKKLDKSLERAFLPNFIPQIGVPLIEEFGNRSTFFDRPLVPKYLENANVQPKYRATNFTSETAKQLVGVLAKMNPKTELTPIAVDNYIRGWTGGLGTHVVDLIDKGLIKSGVSPIKTRPEATPADLPLIKAFASRYPTAGANSIQDFYDLSDERRQAKGTIDYMRKHGQPELAQSIAEEEAVGNPRGIRTQLGKMFGAARGVYEDPQMPADDKRKLLDIMYLQMIAMAKKGLAEMEATSKPTPPPPPRPRQQPQRPQPGLQ